MSNILNWIIITFANLISILLGAYSGYKFIKAYLDRKDLMKYQGYLFTAFFLIVIFPMIFTIFSLKIMDFSENNNILRFNVETNDQRSLNGNIYFSTISDDNINLRIKNIFSNEKDFTIKISCNDDPTKCQSVKSLIISPEKPIRADPSISIDLPIKINYNENELSSGIYSFNITVISDNKTYDEIPLTISIE